MLTQASVQQVRSGEIDRAKSYIAICMRLYPRNFPKAMRDEYLSSLAPSRALIGAFKEKERQLGHEKAFAAVDFEKKFELNPEMIAELQRLAKLGQKQNVYLVCQCPIGERCHRELLLLAAKEALGTEVGKIHHSYPVFQARLPKIKQAAMMS